MVTVGALRDGIPPVWLRTLEVSKATRTVGAVPPAETTIVTTCADVREAAGTVKVEVA